MIFDAAEFVFSAAVVYLEICGWGRDGDDKGIWIDPQTGESFDFGDALTLQLEHDGVSMRDEALRMRED